MLLKLGRKRFIILTTSSAGLRMAKGLVHAGHLLIGIGIGASSTGMPIGSVSRQDARRILSPNENIIDVSLEDPEAVTKFFEKYSFDFALISWPKLLGQTALKAAHNHVIGTHPTCLPYGRGRHPLHWMRVLGITRSSVTAFWLDLGVDSGRILASTPFRITKSSYISGDVIALEKAYSRLGFELGCRFLFGIPVGRKQEISIGTTWRKRTPADTHIDFRMTPEAIIQHVKSISKPWPLATMQKDGSILRIESASRAPLALMKRKYKWSVFGSVLAEKLAADGHRLLVRCYGGAVWLTISSSGDECSD